MRHSHTPSRQKLALRFGGTVSLLTLAALLIVGHAQAVLTVQEVSLPLAAEIPELEQRLSTLTAQLEAAELANMMRTNTQAEHVAVYVFPEDINYDRITAAVEVVFDVLHQQGLASPLNGLEIGTGQDFPEHRAYPLSLEVAISQDGLAELLAVLDLAGSVTIADALVRSERALLLSKTEAENPAGIVNVEQFLATDLLKYTKATQSMEAELLRSLSSPSFVATLETVTQTPRLRDARRILSGPMGQIFEDQKLWPLPLLDVQDLQVKQGSAPGWYTLNLRLHAYSKAV